MKSKLFVLFLLIGLLLLVGCEEGMKTEAVITNVSLKKWEMIKTSYEHDGYRKSMQDNEFSVYCPTSGDTVKILYDSEEKEATIQLNVNHRWPSRLLLERNIEKWNAACGNKSRARSVLDIEIGG